MAEADARTRMLIDKALASGKALGNTEIVDARNVAGALTRLATDMPFDVVVLGGGLGKRSGHATGVKLVRRMFQLWPWMPVVVVSNARPRGCLMAQLLASGVRDCQPGNVTAAKLARSIAWAARGAATRRPARNVATIKRIFGFLEEHVGEPLAFHELAVMAKMSRSHFSRTFHSVAGTPLRKYVRDLQLKRASELLVTSRLSLTSVAVESGFYDLPHLDKAFRQRLGMSPRQFRNRP